MTKSIYLETTDTSRKKSAVLISVYDKTGVLELAQALYRMGYTILASGGTYKTLVANFEELPDLDSRAIVAIDEYTNSPEMLGGRVKTLHPKIHAGILAQRNKQEDMQDLENNNILAIDLVVVNLYPFQSTIEKEHASLEFAIEQIDIGGVTLLRAAAKNYVHTISLASPEDYAQGIELLQQQNTAKSTEDTAKLQLHRQHLAAKTFALTAHYEATIAQYMLQKSTAETVPLPDSFAPSPYLTLPFEKKETLRYGENPHQQATIFRQTWPPANTNSILSAKQLHGKQLSFNNIRDAEAALALAKTFVYSEGFSSSLALGIKHGNPCGVALASTIEEAWKACYKADNKSIFGGIVALSDEVDETTAELLAAIFLEIIIAPKFSKKAMEILTKKKNIRLLELPFATKQSDTPSSLTQDSRVCEQQYFSISGGLLAQDLDSMLPPMASLEMPTNRKVTKSELSTLLFAWKVCKHVKSNGIVIAKHNSTLGIGAGQMNRVGAAEIALAQAKQAVPQQGVATKALAGAVMASDAFFPMSDTVALAAEYGIDAIIQPGGSIKDQDSIDECNKHNIAMVFTGMRHFLH